MPVKPTRSGGSHSKTKYQNIASLKSKLSYSFRKSHSGEDKSIDESDQASEKEHCSQCARVILYFIVQKLFKLFHLLKK